MPPFRDETICSNESPPAAADSGLLIACLCADWCGTCRTYSPLFDQLRLESAGSASTLLWVDIEDDSAVLGSIEVDEFPFLLIARQQQVLFFGSVLPQAAHLRQLLERARAGDLRQVVDPEVTELVARLTQLSARTVSVGTSKTGPEA